MKNNVIAAPCFFLAAMEPLLASLELVQSFRPTPEVLPRGKGEPVLVIPGLGAGPALTWLLRKRLKALNYDARDWGLGINLGPGRQSLAAWISPLADRVRQLAEAANQEVTLVGWSLGGLVARELSKSHPELIKKVITMGTPVQGFESSTNAKWVYSLFNRESQGLSAKEGRALSKEPPVPSLAIFSHMDGVVAWEACQQKNAKRTKAKAIPCASHIGMTVNLDVLKVLALELCKPR